MQYKKEIINIGDLLVNPENPRFDPVRDQNKALMMMMTELKSKIQYLAKDIAINGLNPGKLWFVLNKNNRYIVLEGNRRLTAIKLINNPRMLNLDANTSQFFQKLQDNYSQNIPQQLECIVFDNLVDASHWIKLEHTGENKGIGLVTWNHIGLERYKSQVFGVILTKGIQLLDYMKRKQINVYNIKATNLDRLVGTPQIRVQIGVEFTKGTVVEIKEEDEILRNLIKVAEAMNKPDFGVAKIYSVELKTKWLNGVLNANQTEDNSEAEEKNGEDVTSSSSTTEQQSSLNRKALIPRTTKIRIENNKVNLIYNELKKLSVDDYRNAVAVLFRVFFEFSVDNFIINNNPKGIDIANQPTFSTKLGIISNFMENKGILTKNELKAIRVAISDPNSIFSVNTFHSYVHNIDNIPLSKDLKASWNNMEKFIEKLWTK